MIKNLEVKNFKSIKHLKLECKRVYVFIGKPNTGKSNILESVGIFSLLYGNIESFVRFENMTNLFYNQDIEKKIEIKSDDVYCEISFEVKSGQFKVKGGSKVREIFSFELNYGYDRSQGRNGLCGGISPFKFYKYRVTEVFQRHEHSFLLPSSGENLLSILLTNKSLRKVVADIFSEFKLKIVLRPQENKIEAQKEVEDVIVSYPYSLVSDTLQRVVFHLAAIETNKDSVIIFEEPESHAFPYYTKFLAERIALDKTNQYFIATHNPYFLLSVLEKTLKDDIGIFITYFEDYQTKVKPLTEKDMQEILDLEASVFFNIDKFLEQE